MVPSGKQRVDEGIRFLTCASAGSGMIAQEGCCNWRSNAAFG